MKTLPLPKGSNGSTSGCKPWWVSIGVHRPHTEYRVPIGFYGADLYPGDVVKPPAHPSAPEGSPFMSGNWQGGDIADIAHGCRDCIIPANRSVEYRRAYYAAVSWADHSLGRAVAKLESLGADVVAKTIVLFHSDHGYQLGELNEWSKKTDTELAVHVPLMMRVPWKASSVGQRTTVKAELVDIYRTLADLAELTNVDPVIETSVQGSSLAAAFDSPTTPPALLANKRAYSQIGRCSCGTYCSGFEVNNMAQGYQPCDASHAGPPRVHECGGNACCQIPQSQFDYMGYTMRTVDRRFTAWVPWNNLTLRVEWNNTQAMGLELFDLAADTGRDFDFAGYSTNVAQDSANAKEVADLLADLHAEVDTWY